MNRVKYLLSEFKYELSIFAVLSMNFLLFFTSNDFMSDILYPLHLVDVKIGLISRTLVGSITGLLWEHPTKRNVFFFHMIIVVITFLLTAIFLGKCVKQAEKTTGRHLLFISIIVAVLPYGFTTFVNLFELLDIYWVLTIVLILLSADNKKTAFLIPLFIFTGLWVHYSFLLAFMPVVYILCFSKCLKEKNKVSYMLTAVMVVVSVSSAIYFLTTLRTFNVISFDEFIEYLIEKAGDKLTKIERHIGLGFRPYDRMHKIEEFAFVPENYPEIVKATLGNMKYALIDTSFSAIFADFILVSPIVTFFSVIWKKAMKTSQNKAEKFIFFLCLITPLVQLCSCFLSSDTSRWLSLLVISQLFLLALFIKERSEPVSEALDTVMKTLTRFRAFIIFIIILYMSIVFVW